MNLENKKSYFIRYSAIWLVMMLCFFVPYLSRGRSLVWAWDGWSQHLKALLYYSDWLQGIVKNVVIHHKLSVPLFSFQIGLGGDIISTLHYYAVGDPLNLLSVFVPSSMMGYFYTFLVWLRIFLAGISFSLFCFYIKKKPGIPVLAGSLFYCFSTYILDMGLHHPFFINPFIYLPLLLIGAEKILEGKSSLLFIFMVFISAVSNFYFFYMLVIITVIYVAIRVFSNWKDHTLAETGRLFLKYCLSGIVGVMMSCAIFLPVMHLLFSGRRMSGSASQGVEFFYPLNYYQEFFASILTPTWEYASTRHTTMSYAGIALICALGIFLYKKKTEYKVGVIVCLAIMLLPMGGKLMNGFSYPSNRWTFGLIFLLAFGIVYFWEDLLALDTGQKKRIILIYSVFVVASLTIGFMIDKARLYPRILPTFILQILNIWFLLGILPNGKRLSKKAVSTGLFVVLLLSVFSNFRVESIRKYNTYSMFRPFTDTKDYLNAFADRAVMKVMGPEDRYYRFGAEYHQATRNSTMVSGLMGTTYYWSLANGDVGSFYDEMGLLNKNDYNLRNLDGVAPLENLASLKYYVIENRPGKQRLVPYGFTRVKNLKLMEYENEKKYSVYKNVYPLPLGYTYDSIVTDRQYDQMECLERQNALVQGVHLSDDDMISGFPVTDIQQNNKKLSYKVVETKSAKIEDHKIIVTGEDSLIRFEITNSDPYSQASVALNDFDFTPPEGLEETYKFNYPALRFTFKEDNEKGVGRMMFFTPSNNVTYTGRHDFMVNLGYHTEPKTRFALKITNVGTYTFKDMTVYDTPCRDYAKYISKLREDVLQNIRYEGNTLTGDINLEKDKILCFSIPYSSGWKALVNGRETEIHKANTMFMAIPLKKGSNQVTLIYRTPLLKTGLLISLLGIILFASYGVYIKRHNNKNRE